ncbi:hypothetical protein [Robiginitomaculum antarcticum]|uniref:hypothetical protein n=1 Tax=Robiginitomaculum antarcticum TaxID=437507 RepID=UPI0012EADC4C|nr:hypothetical protein [Robiginitomaculum antarcticum]
MLLIFILGMMSLPEIASAEKLCSLDVSDDYLETEVLGNTQSEIEKLYSTKLFPVRRYGDEWIETRLNICGDYELSVQFLDGRVKTISSEHSIFYYNHINLFDTSLAEIEKVFPEGDIFWAWHEGAEIFFRFKNSSLTLSYGHVEGADLCLKDLKTCPKSDQLKPKTIFTYIPSK